MLLPNNDLLQQFEDYVIELRCEKGRRKAGEKKYNTIQYNTIQYNTIQYILFQLRSLKGQ
jgi:hypothetical protein